MDQQIQDAINRVAQKATKLVEAKEFYFQKAQDALKAWLDMDLPESVKIELLSLADDYKEFQERTTSNETIKNIFNLLLEIIAYCDVNARHKNLLNKYEDKRVLADANVRMNSWIHKLIFFKFDRDKVGPGSPRNAFAYLLDPESQTTILSNNHRLQISTNLLELEEDSEDFVRDLKDFFSDYKLPAMHPANVTQFLSVLIYEIKDMWKEEVVGLLASDRTDWKEEFVSEIGRHDGAIVWNTKRPARPIRSLKALRSIVDDGETFPLYYSVGGSVGYCATIVDFAQSQQELEDKLWDGNGKKIFNYYPKFEQYVSGDKKARILFLAKSFEKITPIPVSSFEFAFGSRAPVHDNLSPIKAMPETAATPNASMPRIENTLPITTARNQILFGPPGTGKTYGSIEKALRIINESEEQNLDWSDRTKVKDLFDRRVAEGRIVFTTFHQSMSYEDFIEGIKPIVSAEDEAEAESQTDTQVVSYDIVPGIFMTICEQAKKKVNTKRDFDELWSGFYKSLVQKGAETFKSTSSEMFFEREYSNEQSIGVRFAKSWDKDEPRGKKVFPVGKELIRRLFVAGVDGGPNVRDQWQSVKSIVYASRATLALGVYRKFWEYAQLQQAILKSETSGAYVLIIDEINRGNVSQIFGELITLIEEDKREGMPEAIRLKLPYSKKDFSVPSNLYIIGTMNTADRSVEALDTALRRRFNFEEIVPNPDLIRTHGKLKHLRGILAEGINLAALMQTINRRILKLLDKDHLIGHSYFMSVSSLAELKSVFHNKFIPLLQEYFFGDPGKIGLVIGRGFFIDDEDEEDMVFAEFNFDSRDFATRKLYALRNTSTMSSSEFIQAIALLMNKDQ